jgi:hypothetical protein
MVLGAFSSSEEASLNGVVYSFFLEAQLIQPLVHIDRSVPNPASVAHVALLLGTE